MTKSDIDIKKITSVSLTELHSYLSDRSTYASLFLIPAFDLELNAKTYELYENSFIDHEGFMHLFDRPLFTLFKVGEKEIKDFQNINKTLTSNPNFVYTYCVGRTNNYYLYMYVFECPKAFEKDYDKFLEGKYSQFSIAYKAKFMRNVMIFDGSYEESPIYGALFKTDKMRQKMEGIVGEKIDPQGEFWSPPKDEYEIFNYTKKIQHVTPQV